MTVLWPSKAANGTRAVFKTVAFVRSAILPAAGYPLPQLGSRHHTGRATLRR